MEGTLAYSPFVPCGKKGITGVLKSSGKNKKYSASLVKLF
jgi:hypothetical protein